MARDPNPFYYAIAPFNAETAHQISLRPDPIVLLLLPKSFPGSAPHELPPKQQWALVQTLTQPAVEGQVRAEFPRECGAGLYRIRTKEKERVRVNDHGIIQDEFGDARTNGDLVVVDKGRRSIKRDGSFDASKTTRLAHSPLDLYGFAKAIEWEELAELESRQITQKAWTEKVTNLADRYVTNVADHIEEQARRKSEKQLAENNMVESGSRNDHKGVETHMITHTYASEPRKDSSKEESTTGDGTPGSKPILEMLRSWKEGLHHKKEGLRKARSLEGMTTEEKYAILRSANAR